MAKKHNTQDVANSVRTVRGVIDKWERQGYFTGGLPQVEEFAQAIIDAIEQEREECAVVIADLCMPFHSRLGAAAIRDRGKRDG